MEKTIEKPKSKIVIPFFKVTELDDSWREWMEQMWLPIETVPNFPLDGLCLFDFGFQYHENGCIVGCFGLSEKEFEKFLKTEWDELPYEDEGIMRDLLQGIRNLTDTDEHVKYYTDNPEKINEKFLDLCLARRHEFVREEYYHFTDTYLLPGSLTDE